MTRQDTTLDAWTGDTEDTEEDVKPLSEVASETHVAVVESFFGSN